MSDVGRVTSGVPQGSILGPILFLIYTADLLSKPKFSTCVAYADDTYLLHHFNPQNIERACLEMNEDLGNISECSSNINLKLNSNKCSVVYFASKSSQKCFVKDDIKVHVDHNQLPVYERIKSLGLSIDNDLRFKNHVSSVIKKCYVALKLLYSNHLILNFKLRKKLCESLVIPHLLYCFTVYFPCLDAVNKYRLQKVQNNCCRFIFGLKKYAHISKYIQQLKWLKIDQLFHYHLATFLFRVFRSSSPKYLRDKFHSRRSLHCTDLSLRYVHHLSMPSFRTSLYTRSFTYNAIKCYNEHYDLFTKICSVESFKKQMMYRLSH